MTASPENNAWDPVVYDTAFGFVTGHGAAVVELLGPVAGDAVLDLGCGTAHLTAQIAARGADPVVGVDLSADMVAAARLAHPQLDIRQGDGQSITLASLGRDDPFDAVFSNAALHWMPDGAAVAAAVRSVLRPGGRFVAELGGAGNVAAVDAALRASLADLGLARIRVPVQNFPTVARQAAWLEDGRFQVRLMRWFERPTPLGAGETPATWTRHFRAMVWSEVPPEHEAALAAAIDAWAADAGLAVDGWHIDYRRLQFAAEAV